MNPPNNYSSTEPECTGLQGPECIVMQAGTKRRKTTTAATTTYMTDSFIALLMNSYHIWIFFKQKMAQTDMSSVHPPSQCVCYVLHFPACPCSSTPRDTPASISSEMEGCIREMKSKDQKCVGSHIDHTVSLFPPKKQNTVSKNSAPGGKKGKFSLVHFYFCEHSVFIFTIKQHDLEKKIPTSTPPLPVSPAQMCQKRAGQMEPGSSLLI